MDALAEIEKTLKEIIAETEDTIKYFERRRDEVKSDHEKTQIGKIIASLETLLLKLKEN